VGIQLTNNAAAIIPLAVGSTDTSVGLASGYGALFPELATGDYFYATIVDTFGNLEIVKVTARADDALTIVRAQEGTIALPFAANSRLELRVTAANITSVVSDLSFLLL